MQQAKERKKQLEKPEKEVRADWSPSEQNISSFLAANESFKKKLRFVPDREPYLINLLEEVATVDDEDDE